MLVGRNGKFSLVLSEGDLAKGLRSTKRNPRNNKGLSQVGGAVGRDGVLTSLDDLDRIDTSVITDDFPFPQIFVLNKVILVCGETDIYEWDGVNLSLKLTVTAGTTWKVVDFLDFIYLSNNKVVVIRDPNTQEYETSSAYPISNAVCNFNGQVLIGAPGTEVP